MTEKIIDAKRAEMEAKKIRLGKIAYNKWAMSHDERTDDTGERFNNVSPSSLRRIQEAEFDLCEEIYHLQLEIDTIQYEMNAH